MFSYFFPLAVSQHLPCTMESLKGTIYYQESDSGYNTADERWSELVGYLCKGVRIGAQFELS
jgi:hypothetical protein